MVTVYPAPTLWQPDWPRCHRIIPSRFPAIDLFERVIDSALFDALYELESMTNDRLREEAGDIAMVDPDDRVFGSGATVVMAAFTHIGRASRFTDGTYGVYYAANSTETAIRETVFSRQRFLASTNEPAIEIDMRMYVGNVERPMHDIRSADYVALHHPDDYSGSQMFSNGLKSEKSWGIVYNSVRHEGGECIAALRPPAVGLPTPSKHFTYVWNGSRVTEWYEKKAGTLL